MHKAKSDSNKLNALKTGMYAHEVLLPWEDVAEFQAFYDDIFNDHQPKSATEKCIVADMVENRWRRRRLRRMMAIATHRHAFGRALEESGAKSWPDALSIAREHNLERNEALQSLATSTVQLTEAAVELKQKSESNGELEKLARRIANGCTKTYKALTRIESALDAEWEFFDAYLPKNLEELVRMENSLDAQYDKSFGRLERIQEARILRETLRDNQKSSRPVQSDENVDEGRLPTAELDRDDNVDTDARRQLDNY